VVKSGFIWGEISNCNTFVIFFIGISICNGYLEEEY